MALSTSALRAPVLSRSVRSVRGTRSTAGRGNVAAQGTMHDEHGDERRERRRSEGMEGNNALRRNLDGSKRSERVCLCQIRLSKRDRDGRGALDGVDWSRGRRRGGRTAGGIDPSLPCQSQR
eukprot:scaffold110_cov315-Pavlova_lutheri.AAC.30